MEDIIKENEEKILNKYTINCIPFEGERYLGNLVITDKALYYDAQYDMSTKGIRNQITDSAIVAAGGALVISDRIKDQWKSKGYMVVSKQDIQNVSAKKSFLKKTVTVELKDGQTIVFDYGMMSVNKVMKDIQY
ncbi:hypothetical protein N9Y60_04350 [Crocinitomicaceae bacterium]|nr:hypothetical protein [Crocinitomicaceae bacterium]